MIKICGIQGVADAIAAAEAGATALGFIFAPSRRRVQLEFVQTVRVALNTAGYDLPLVGVMVNPTASEMQVVDRRQGIDVIQLSGDESPEVLAADGAPILKALRFPSNASSDIARREVEAWLNHPRSLPAVLVDTFVAGEYGGAGKTGDWELARELASEFPVVLAGGLSPENVASAIGIVRPVGVDVSSGVETDLVKDPSRISALVKQATNGFRETVTHRHTGTTPQQS